jgi:hypothetical protein
MTAVSTGYPVSQAHVKPLDMSKLKPVQLTGEALQSHLARMEKLLEARHQQLPDLSGHPAYQDYATVEVNGQVVATIDNHGFTTTSNSVGARIGRLLPGDVNGQTGPVLAQARADIIAKALGGKVVKSASALTQAQFNGLPQPTATVDVEAMRADPLFAALEKSKQAASAFAAQQIAQEGSQEGTRDAGAAEDAEGGSPAVRAFLEYMAKTPEERYFETFLTAKGMTQEEFDALPAEEKRALLKDFEAYVKQSVENDSAEKVARTSRSELL